MRGRNRSHRAPATKSVGHKGVGKKKPRAEGGNVGGAKKKTPHRYKTRLTEKMGENGGKYDDARLQQKKKTQPNEGGGKGGEKGKEENREKVGKKGKTKKKKRMDRGAYTSTARRGGRKKEKKGTQTGDSGGSRGGSHGWNSNSEPGMEKQSVGGKTRGGNTKVWTRGSRNKPKIRHSERRVAKKKKNVKKGETKEGQMARTVQTLPPKNKWVGH